MSVTADDWAPIKASSGDDWAPVAKATPEPPADADLGLPASFLERFNAGAAAQEREAQAAKRVPSGIDLLSSPEGRTKLWNAVKSYPQHFLEGTLETLKTPGDVYSGAADLGTEEGMDRAMGLGTLVGLGRLNKLPLTGETAGMALRAGEGIGRISQDPGGQITIRPVGDLPQETDFANAKQVLSPNKFSSLSDDQVRAEVSKWTQGMHTGANTDILPEAVRRFGAPLQTEATFYRGEWPGRPNLANENGTISVSDREGGNSFSMARNDAELEKQMQDGEGPPRLPISEIIVPAGTKVLDAAPLAGKNARELERMLPPGKFVLQGERAEPWTFAGNPAEHIIKTYRFEPLGDPVEANLRRMWRDDGIHPAEAVHDAEQDAFLKHDITAKQETIKLDPADEEVLTETGGAPRSLGAAATDPDPDLATIAQQPARPPGSLAATFQKAADTLLDIGRDAQMLTAPMARGTTDSMAIAKDFANSMRRNRWDWSRVDKDIADRFTPEQRARMWNAADEESTSLQLGEPASMREHQGLATLEPAERAAVEELHTRAQNAWVRARDAGMVEGEGLPAYTPRMIINTMGAGSKEAALALDGIGRNLKTKTANMLKRKYLEAQDTEAAAKAKYGDEAMLARDIRVLPLATSQLEDAIAGRSLINNIKDYGARTGTDTVVEGAIPAGGDAKWFTLDHPAFKTWRPKFEEVDGKVQAVKDADGKTIFEQVPIYVHGDFEGPLRAVLSQKSGPLYGAAMSLKGKTMSLIMNSPMIHNAVEWGRALPAMPGKVATFKVYFEGNRAKNNVPLMQEAIDNGLVPIGHRFFNQDISGLMESPDLTPGRSWTAKVLAAVPGLFDEAAGTAVKQAIDKAGDFWHNTLLWDRIADLQMGLYKNFLDDSVAKGIDRTTASRMAAHWANRYAGALPKEAMSDAATKVANMMMFSRSFTMGNLGVLKDAFTGLPKDVIAQIERDAGFGQGSIAAADETNAAVSYAKSMARRKAMAVVAMDMGLMYVGNSMLQNVMNVLLGDSTLDKELHGYAQRFMTKMQAVKEHPLELVQPLRLLGDISATSENEPGKGDRVRVGYAKDGTAIYARNPAGKIGDEFVGYMTGPLDMMRKKMSTIARPAWQVMSNDAGFGRKVYDPGADTPAKYLANLGKIVAHIAGSQLPQGQIGAFSDLVKGEGDAKVNALQAFGPFLGTTFSKGAPGGPAVGEMYAARTQHDFAVQNAMPDIRKQIQRGDVPGASQRMQELGIPPGLQRFYVRTTLNPATRLSARGLRDFYRYATPEQRDRMERAQQAPPPQ